MYVLDFIMLGLTYCMYYTYLYPSNYPASTLLARIINLLNQFSVCTVGNLDFID